MDREATTYRINELQDKVVAKHARRIGKAIEKAWTDVAEELPTYARPDLPLDHVRQVRTALEELYRDITRQTAAAMVGQFKSGFAWLETKDDMSDFYERLYEEYLNIYGLSSIAQISEATRRQITGAIERGLTEGLSLPEIADDLRARAPDIGEVRAMIIARTETHSASMYASTESAKRSTVPLVKEWVSVEDGRVRDFGEGDGVVDAFSHRAMNGVQVPLDDPFTVPMSNGLQEKMMFPGDPAGSAGNVINCRCSQVYEAADEDEVEDDVVQAPKPLTPERPTFQYNTREAPAANYAALEAFFETAGIADEVLVRSIPAAALSKVSLQFLEVKERFGLDPMYGLGTASRFKNKLRLSSAGNALAAVYPVTHKASGRKAIFHLPSTFGQPKRYNDLLYSTQHAQTRAKYRDKQNSYVQQHGTTNEEVYDRALIMDERGDLYGWTVDANAKTTDDMIRSTIYHEFGHVVHLSNTAVPQMGIDLDNVLASARPRQNGWGALVSEYGTSGTRADDRHRDKEYIAETFALYMAGEEQHYRIHPEILAVYQRYDKASSVKSFRLQRVNRMQTKAIEPLQDPNDGVQLIQTVLNTPENERGKVIKALLAAYTDVDKPLIEAWLYEALALEVVDTI